MGAVSSNKIIYYSYMNTNKKNAERRMSPKRWGKNCVKDV